MNKEKNNASSPKTASFQMRINPGVKKQVEDVYAEQGMTLTDAVNIFIQQSINMRGLPFLASAENEDYIRAKATVRLMEEIERGWAAADEEGWVSEAEAYKLLGVDYEA
jgi:DNA-damage-inducible protein J